MSVDPLANIFPYISPYNFDENNPLKLVDPTGMGPEEGGPKTHTIVENVTYYGLANRTYKDDASVTVENLRKWNPSVDENDLQIGQTINISDPNENSASAESGGNNNSDGATGVNSNSGSSSSSSASSNTQNFGDPYWGSNSEQGLKWPDAKKSGDYGEIWRMGGGLGKFNQVLGQAKYFSLLNRARMAIDHFDSYDNDFKIIYIDSTYFDTIFLESHHFDQHGNPIDTTITDTLLIEKSQRVRKVIE